MPSNSCSSCIKFLTAIASFRYVSVFASARLLPDFQQNPMAVEIGYCLQIFFVAYVSVCIFGTCNSRYIDSISEQREREKKKITWMFAFLFILFFRLLCHRKYFHY